MQDKGFLANQAITDELTLKFCGIAIGWSWTNVAVTECAMTFTLTCPESTFENYVWYAVNVLAYYIVAIKIYHDMMEGHRLANRCRKVIAIEDGNGVRIFSSMKDHDEDDDGLLNKKELETFITAEGINVEPFQQAAARVDAKDGVVDGEVTVDDLMTELEVLIRQIKSGEYIPGEFEFGEPTPSSGGTTGGTTNEMQEFSHGAPTMGSGTVRMV